MSKIKLSEIKEEYKLLQRDLEREQCVLLIGPEILRVNGETFLLKKQAELYEAYKKDKVPFYYSKDSLFVFKDPAAKSIIQGDVVDYLDAFSNGNNLADPLHQDLFKKIAELPFHLILSVNPDHYLSETFAKYGVRHRFAYFHHNGSGVEEVDEPRHFLPLIYNIFGSKDKESSLVLDYEDLFKLLKTLLGKPGLPNKLQSKLAEAKSFLFLGFRFDRWYSQLLLQLLVGERSKEIRKYAIEPPPDNDTCTFMLSQTGLKFLGDDHRYFRLLFNLCKENTKIYKRHLLDIKDPVPQAIFQLIQMGDTGKAMNTFQELFKGAPEEKEAVQLVGQYVNLEKQMSLGLVKPEDAQIEINRIMYVVLEMVNNKIKKDAVTN